MAVKSRLGLGFSASRRSAQPFHPNSKPKFFAGFLAALLLTGLLCADRAAAAVAGGFSLGVGEEYNDNIFFSTQPGKENVNDWVTHIVPTFSLLYASPGDPTPVLTSTLSPEIQFYAHNSRQNNFADNLRFNTAYTYKFSPTLNFNLADNLTRRGLTRTIGLDAMGPPPQLPATPSDLPSLGTFVPLPLVEDIGSLVSKGRSLTNSFSLQPVYLFSPVFTISGGYGAGFSRANGKNDYSHAIGVRGIYNWRQEHKLFAGYTANIFHSGRTSTVIHTLDFGDDYFTGWKIPLAPTWTLSGAFGLAINFGGEGPAVSPNVNVTLLKRWENATLNLAIRRGQTNSLELFSGLSTTTTFSAGYGIRLTERLTGLLGADYTLMGAPGTTGADIEVFRAAAGLQYWITRWLSSNLWYSRRWRSAVVSAVGVPDGTAGGNSVLLAITAHFDVYPNPGLARDFTHPLYAPMGAPTYERTELQQPLRPPTGPVEMQQPLQQPLREPGLSPAPKPPASDAQTPDSAPESR
jgi:hypothetical protein